MLIVIILINIINDFNIILLNIILTMTGLATTPTPPRPPAAAAAAAAAAPNPSVPPATLLLLLLLLLSIACSIPYSSKAVGLCISVLLLPWRLQRELPGPLERDPESPIPLK